MTRLAVAEKSGYPVGVVPLRDVQLFAPILCLALSVGCAANGSSGHVVLGEPPRSLQGATSNDDCSATAGVERAPSEALAASLSVPGAPTAQPVMPEPRRLSPFERKRVMQGWTVKRPFNFDHQQRRYVGGIAYQMVRADAEQILDTLIDVEQLPAALPLTHQARLLEADSQGLTVELVQGNALVRVRYSIRLQRVSAEAVRFWLDKRRPHDIADAWGYFKVSPIDSGRSLLTAAVALDLGSELSRALFEKQVQRVALSAPAHVRHYVEPRVQSWPTR